jgi:hypothetical protein
MTAGAQSALVSRRLWRPEMKRALGLAFALLLVVCQSTADRPIVYTAPPDVLARIASSSPDPAATPYLGFLGFPADTASGAPSVPPAATGGASASGPVGQAMQGQVIFGNPRRAGRVLGT